MNAIGKAIRQLRLDREWGQETVALRIGLSTSAYSKIECGITDINLSRLEHIARVFEINIPELLKLAENYRIGTHPMVNIGLLRERLIEREAEIRELHKKIELIEKRLRGSRNIPVMTVQGSIGGVKE
jgi:transcriptional regulator with XRE-family HTH domain